MPLRFLWQPNYYQGFFQCHWELQRHIIERDTRGAPVQGENIVPPGDHINENEINAIRFRHSQLVLLCCSGVEVEDDVLDGLAAHGAGRRLRILQVCGALAAATLVHTAAQQNISLDPLHSGCLPSSGDIPCSASQSTLSQSNATCYSWKPQDRQYTCPYCFTGCVVP